MDRIFKLLALTVPPKGIMGGKWQFYSAQEIDPKWTGTQWAEIGQPRIVAVRRNVGYCGVKVQCGNVHEDKGNGVLFLKGARQLGQHISIKEQRTVIKANRKAQKQSA